jgi:hypothetical protein
MSHRSLNLSLNSNLTWKWRKENGKRLKPCLGRWLTYSAQLWITPARPINQRGSADSMAPQGGLLFTRRSYRRCAAGAVRQTHDSHHRFSRARWELSLGAGPELPVMRAGITEPWPPRVRIVPNGFAAHGARTTGAISARTTQRTASGDKTMAALAIPSPPSCLSSRADPNI